MEFETIRLVVEGGIATVTMDRPPVNAIGARLRLELTEAFGAISEREDVRVAILTGAGHVFSAGVDLKERGDVTRNPGDLARNNHAHRSYIDAFRSCAKPVIAALNGPAIGTGFGMAAACDIMLASENAWISMPEVTVGIPSGAATLNRVFGPSKGRRLFYTGAKVPAAELYRLGIIEACVPRDALLAEAMVIAREIAARSPAVIRAAKQCYNLAQDTPYAVAKSFEYAMGAQIVHGEESRAALEAAAGSLRTGG